MRKAYDAWPLGIFLGVCFYFIGIVPFFEYKAGDKDWDYFFQGLVLFCVLGTVSTILGIIGMLMQKDLIGFAIFDFDRMVAWEAYIKYEKRYKSKKGHCSVRIWVTEDLQKVMLNLSDEEIILKRSSKYLQKRVEINQWNKGTWFNIENALKNASRKLREKYPGIEIAVNTNRHLRAQCDRVLENNITEWSKIEGKNKIKAIIKIIFSEQSLCWLFALAFILLEFCWVYAKANEAEVAAVVFLWKESKLLSVFILLQIIVLSFSAYHWLSFIFAVTFGKGRQCVGRIVDARYIPGTYKGRSPYYSLHIEGKKNGEKVTYKIDSDSARYKHNRWKDDKNIIMVTVNEKDFILIDC